MVMTVSYMMDSEERFRRFTLFKECILSKPGQEPTAPHLIHPDRQKVHAPRSQVPRKTQQQQQQPQQ